MCAYVCVRARQHLLITVREISLKFPSFSSFFTPTKLLSLSQSDEDDTIIILGGKSGHVCLGDRSGRSEHIPTDLKGVLLVLFVFALFRLREKSSESLLRLIVSTFLTRPKRLFLRTRRALLKGV